MKYAILKNGSGQQKVHEGDKIQVAGTVTKPQFEVLFFSDGKNVFTDKADLKDISVEAKVLNTARSRKLVVGRYKSKSRYDKLRGFRAEYTNVLISGINHKSEKSQKAEKPTTEETEKPKKTPVAKTKVSTKLEKKEKGAPKEK